MVDYSSLENYRTERYRGFESLSLRKQKRSPLTFQRVSFFFVTSHFSLLTFHFSFFTSHPSIPMQLVVPIAVRAAVRILTMT